MSADRLPTAEHGSYCSLLPSNQELITNMIEIKIRSKLLMVWVGLGNSNFLKARNNCLFARLLIRHAQIP